MMGEGCLGGIQEGRLKGEGRIFRITVRCTCVKKKKSLFVSENLRDVVYSTILCERR